MEQEAILLGLVLYGLLVGLGKYLVIFIPTYLDPLHLQKYTYKYYQFEESQ